MIKRSAVVAVLLLTATHAHAQWVVVDPTLNQTALATFAKEALTEVHAAQDVVNTGQTVVHALGILNSVAHGNIMGLTQLAPLLQDPRLSQPLGTNTPGIANMMSGLQDASQMGNGLSGLYASAKGLTTVYSPGGSDYMAQSIVQRANATAGQLAVAARYMDSGSTRLSSLPGLVQGAEVTADLKSSVDAGNTLTGQQLTQSAQTNQLLALQIYQRANADAQQGRDEQAWRQSADQLGTSAKAAATAAASGQIQFITP